MNIKDIINNRGRAIARTLATAAVAMSAALTACTDNDDTSNLDEGRIPISISTATIGASSDIGTRATDNEWEAGDKINIFLYNKSATSIDGKTHRYVTKTGDGTFTPDGKYQTAYYPDDGSEVWVLAAYPAGSGAISYSIDRVDMVNVTIDLSDQTDISAIDFMTAVNYGSSENPAVKLAFHHQLTKLSLDIQPAEGADIDLSGATLSYTGAYTSARLRLIGGGGFTLYDDNLGDIAIPLMVSDGGKRAQAQAIVVPVSTMEGSTFVITVPAKDGGEARVYTATPGALALKSGTLNTLTITLPADEAQEAVISGVSIKDWTTGTSASLVAIDVQAPDEEADEPAAGNFQPTDGGTLALTLTNAADATDNATAAYTYDAATGKWGSTAPLVWDFLTRDATYAVGATYTPATADAVTAERDILAATATAAFGTAISLTGDNALRHTLSKLTVKVVINATHADGTPMTLSAARIDGLKMSSYLRAEIEGGDGNGNGNGGTFSITPSNKTYEDFIFHSAALSKGEERIVCPQTVDKDAALVFYIDGKEYSVNLSESIDALEAGIHHLLVVTLESNIIPGKVGDVKVAVSAVDWTYYIAELEHEVVIKTPDGVGGITADGFTDGTLSILVENEANADEYATGDYTFDANAGKWVSDAPVYWDGLNPDAIYTVYAVYTPDEVDAVTGEADVLLGKVTGVGFGEAIAFTGDNALKHANSKLTLKVVDANNFGIAKVEVVGLGDYTNFTYTAAGVATGESHLVAPQVIDGKAKIVITSSAGNTYSYTLSNGIKELVAGTNHTLTLSLIATGITAVIGVTDWADGGDINGNVTID